MDNPVSKTAWYCTGVRARDARSADPLVGDTWAERFLDDEGQAVSRGFESFTAANGANITRHYLIDQWLQARLQTQPDHRVLLLGAGFDSRAFRLPGGSWIEVDEPAVIARKEHVGPAGSALNPLIRVPVNFAQDSLADKLKPYATPESITVVMEGVMYYLEPAAVQATLAVLGTLFPRHELICDLQTDAFVRRWGKPIIEYIGRLGAHWRFHPADPERFITGLGYRSVERVSIILRAAELKRAAVPPFVVRWFLPALRKGYCLYRFERIA
ncbi:MAG: class I SAM-dependent methyltransferase [Burkholderiales bacterium]|nr:class I SAM-dependent methyltransferase [Burkholderiales bacterium]